jgi:hypothetical protein
MKKLILAISSVFLSGCLGMPESVMPVKKMGFETEKLLYMAPK